MYYIKITDGDEVFFYRTNRYATKFYDIDVFVEYTDALLMLNLLRAEHQQKHDQEQQSIQHAYFSYTAEYREKLLRENEERRNKIKFEILDLTDYPEDVEFSTAFSIDSDTIPEQDRDVCLIYRDGTKMGVVTNFLRKEMMKGHYLYLENKSEFVRWMYVEDSPFLKYKKMGLVVDKE